MKLLLNSLGSGKARGPGDLAAEVEQSGAEVDFETGLVTLSALMGTLLGVAQQSTGLGFCGAGSQWATLVERAKQDISKAAIAMKGDVLALTRSYIVEASSEDKNVKEALAPFATQCAAWRDKVKNQMSPVKALCDGLVPTLAGVACFLQASMTMLSLEMPSEASIDAMLPDNFHKLKGAHDTAGQGLFQQPGLGVYEALNSAGGAASEPFERIRRHRESAATKHGELQNILIKSLHRKIVATRCDSIQEDTPLDETKATLEAVQPIASALISLNPAHENAKEAREHVSRSCRII